MSDSGASTFIEFTSDSSNNIYVSGSTKAGLDGANQGGHDAFVAKFDSKMHRLWTRQIGASNQQSGEDVAVDSAGNVYLVGWTSSVDNVDGQTGSGLGNYDVFITKYNSSGVKQWTRQFAGKAQHPKVAVNSSGEVYAIGMTAHEMGGATRISTNTSFYDAFIARYDSSGNPIAVGGDNATLFGTTRTDWPRDIVFDLSLIHI